MMKIWYAFGLSVVGVLLLTALWANVADCPRPETKDITLELHPNWKKISENSTYMRTESKGLRTRRKEQPTDSRKTMSTPRRKIYISENGDSWWLCREDGGRVYVLHETNLLSGGTTPKIEIGDFLSTGKRRSEHQSLLRPDR
jgi:hypothetical protein